MTNTKVNGDNLYLYNRGSFFRILRCRRRAEPVGTSLAAMGRVSTPAFHPFPGPRVSVADHRPPQLLEICDREVTPRAGVDPQDDQVPCRHTTIIRTR